jgi:hypothetical protein
VPEKVIEDMATEAMGSDPDSVDGIILLAALPGWLLPLNQVDNGSVDDFGQALTP